MVTGTRLQFGQYSIPLPAETRDYSLLKSSDQLWGPLGLLFYGYQWSFCQDQSIQAMDMSIHFRPVPRLRMSGAVHPLPYMLL